VLSLAPRLQGSKAPRLQGSKAPRLQGSKAALADSLTPRYWCWLEVGLRNQVDQPAVGHGFHSAIKAFTCHLPRPLIRRHKGSKAALSDSLTFRYWCWLEVGLRNQVDQPAVSHGFHSAIKAFTCHLPCPIVRWHKGPCNNHVEIHNKKDRTIVVLANRIQ